MKSLERQIRGLILRFLEKLYPDGATVAFLEGLLADWQIFVYRQVVEEHLRWLINRGYVEAKGIKLPAPADKVGKFIITAKGKALLSGELIDAGVSFEGLE
jgi:hypothetical protein